MIKNIGMKDKATRIAVAIILGIIGIFTYWWLLLIAAIVFLTAVIGFCPLYPLFKINTNKTNKSSLNSKVKPKLKNK
jgi:hypothetical protein